MVSFWTQFLLEVRDTEMLTEMVDRMTKVSEAYKWEEMSELTEEDLENLLLFYPANKVPDIDILRSLRGPDNDPKKLDVFDGSFGFSVGS
jgi:precorrin-2 dehydrogenase/sirohydrochlorin ferrochelatase